MNNPTCKVCNKKTGGPYQDIETTLQFKGYWNKGVYVIKGFDYLSGEMNTY